MIFEAYIEEVPTDVKKPIKVRIPLYNNEVYQVSYSATPPGIRYQLNKKGTKVLICFLNNDLSKPVIVGVVNLDANVFDTANTIVDFNKFEVATKAVLPEDTTINGSAVLTRKDFEDAMDKFLSYLNDCLEG